MRWRENIIHVYLSYKDIHEIRLSAEGGAFVLGSCFEDTTTLQKSVSPGKKTLDDKDASTITINSL